MFKRAIKKIMLTESNTLAQLLWNLARLNFVISPIACAVFFVGFWGSQDFGYHLLSAWLVSLATGTVSLCGAEVIKHSRILLLRLLGRLQPRYTVLFAMLSAVSFMLPGLYLGFALSRSVMEKLGRPWLRQPDTADYSSGVLIGTFICALFLLIEMVIEQRQTEKKASEKLKDLESKRLEAEVAALSAQLNPHFLFNSLNTIAATIPERPDDAEEMVVRLADLYRSILRAAKKQTHPLAEELRICRSYLEIESLRFGKRVEFAIEVSEELKDESHEIPVLLVQPLVENAIKHGLAPKSAGGRILIEAWLEENSLLIQVADDGIGNAGPGRAGEGTGLKNGSARLGLLYGDKASQVFAVDAAGARVRIRLPSPISDLRDARESGGVT